MSFSIKELQESQVSAMVEAGVWSEECPVHHTRLRITEVNYITFDDTESTGSLVVLDEISEEVISIFRQLLVIRFPIQSVIPVEEFGGDDILSMEANNSSAFNGRKIMNTDRWSSHSFGVAIDINPHQNPYMRLNEADSTIKVYPSQAMKYVNRGIRNAGMAEDVVRIFSEYGFTEWGGSWADRPDYHHFQLPWERIKTLFPQHSF